MLEVGNGGMTAEEYRTHMSLWAMLRAPLIAGNDLRSMTDETKSILMNPDVIAIDQDPYAKPLQVLSVEGKSEVLVRPLDGDAVAVACSIVARNPPRSAFAGIACTLAPISAARAWQARDLWKHQDLPVSGDSFTATVPKHGVVLLRVTADSFRFR